MTLAYYIMLGALLIALGGAGVLAIALGYLVLLGLSVQDLRSAPIINRITLPKHPWRHLLAFVGTCIVCAFIGCFAETIIQLSN